MTELRENIKWALLDHSFRLKRPYNKGSPCFMKILCMDKYAFLLARVHQVFRFKMDVRESEVIFFFTSQDDPGKNKSADFKLPYKQAKRFIKLLKPKFFDASVSSGVVKSKSFDLMNLATGKLALEIQSDVLVPDISKAIWARVDELNCSVGLFYRVGALTDESKVFDKLTVRDVNNYRQLAMCLKRKAKVLDLCLLKYIAFNPENSILLRDVSNAFTKKCCLRVDVYMSQAVPFVRSIANTFHTLKQLEISVRAFDVRSMHDMNEFLNAISELYGNCLELVEYFENSEIVAKVDYHAHYLCAYFPLPADWKAQLENRLGVEGVHVQASDGNLLPKWVKVWFKIKRGETEFKFSVGVSIMP